MTDDTPTGRRGGLAARLAAIALVGLVAGFVLGWFMRGDSGTATILPPADTPAATTPARTVTGTTPGTTTAPADLPPRGGIRLAVLNGTDVAGLAARTASRAQGLGYPSPATGNAPSGTGPTVVYFRQGARDAARRVAQDLEFTQVRALPGSGPITTAAPADAQVVVVLGPG